MKKLIFIAFLLCSTKHLLAQKDTIHLKEIARINKNVVTDRAPQALYFQIAGSGPFLSVNYDRRFQKKLNGFGFAAGLGYFGIQGVSIFSIPVSLNYLIGHNTHFFEFAAGTTFVSAKSTDIFGTGSTSSESGLIYHLNIGYRYQPTKGGFFFRGGYSPLFASGAGGPQQSIYLGFGHNF